MNVVRFLALVALLSVLSGCGLLGGQPQPTPQATQPSLPLELPSPAPQPTPIVGGEESQPTVEPVSCAVPLFPADGAMLGTSGQEQLGWTEYLGASGYLVLLTAPDGKQSAALVSSNQYDLDLESLPQSGIYQWSVAVLGVNSQVLCNSIAFTFTKPESAAGVLPTEEGMSVPAETAVPTATPSNACMTLLTPQNTAKVHRTSIRAFTWTPVRGASKYIVAITPPGMLTVRFQALEPTLTRSMAAFNKDGTYKWDVTAYNASGQVLCTSDTYEFVLGNYPVPPPVPGTCVTLLTPKNQTEFPAVAQVDFTWSAYPGATQYTLTIIPPGGLPVNFLAIEPFKTRSIEAFREGGTYQWFVSALQANGAILCTSDIYTFTKPKTVIPTPKP